jgi:hypothetical protein
MNRFVRLAALSLVATPLAAARADLVFGGIVTVGGTGLGTVNTVLTITSQANNTSEEGCVTPTSNGTSSALGTLSGNTCNTGTVSADIQTGASQTLTRNLGATGVTSATNFAILLNAAEPSGNSISLNNLVAYFMNSTGGTFSAPLSCPGTQCDFNSTSTGTGNSGFMFQLNSTEASAFQTFINSAGGVNNIWVGLGALAGTTTGFEATGGQETFFVFNSGQATTTPEPSTTVLMASGLVGLFGYARRRRRR